MEHTAHPPAIRHVRTAIPAEVARQLDILKADLRCTHGTVTVAELLAEGVVLLLRYHGRSVGLPEPLAQMSASTTPSTTANTKTTTSI